MKTTTRNKSAWLKTISLLLFQILSITGITQNWEILYGSSYKNEKGKDVIETYDKGYLLVSGWDSKYIWVIKTDINGDILWEKTYSNNDKILYINKVIETSDNGYVMVGLSRFYDDQHSDPIILKFNSCFEQEWCKILYKADRSGLAMDVIENTDGLLMVLTFGNNDNPDNNISIYGLTLAGDLLWGNEYARTEDYPLLNELAQYDLIQVGNSYYTSGWGYYSYPGNPTIFWLRPFIIGIDSNFQEKWILPYGLNDSLVGEGWHLSYYDENTILSFGWKIFQENNQAVVKSLLMMFNGDGEELGYYIIENDSIDPSIVSGNISSLQILNDSLFLANGLYSEDEYYYPSGEVIFDKFGNVYNFVTHPNTSSHKRLIRTFNDKFLQCANYLHNNNNYDALLYKYNENLEYDSIYTGNYTYDSLCGTSITSDTILLDGCIITGIGETPSSGEYYSFIKTIPIKAYPNPTTQGSVTFEYENTQHHTNIELKCFNIYGEAVYSEKVYRYQEKSEVEIATWRNGLYVVVVYSEGLAAGRCKFVVNH